MRNLAQILSIALLVLIPVAAVAGPAEDANAVVDRGSAASSAAMADMLGFNTQHFDGNIAVWQDTTLPTNTYPSKSVVVFTNTDDLVHDELNLMIQKAFYDQNAIVNLYTGTRYSLYGTGGWYFESGANLVVQAVLNVAGWFCR